MNIFLLLKMFLYAVILLIGSVICFDMPQNWLNPSDLHHSRKIAHQSASMHAVQTNFVTEPVATEKTELTNRNDTCICSAPSPSASDSYLKRMINILLQESHMKNYQLLDGDIRMVPMTFRFTHKNLEVLHAFASTENPASSDEEALSWTDFDQAFSSLLRRSDYEEEKKNPNVFVTHHDYTQFIFISIVGSFVIVGLWMLLTSGSLFKTVIGVCFLNFAVALFWNLNRAYNSEKEKLNKINKADESLLPENNPMFNVDYGKVVVETICTIFNVLPVLGEKTGQMSYNYFDEQSYFVKYVVQPIAYTLNPLILALFLLLFAFVKKGFTIRLPFFSIGTQSVENPAPQLQRNDQQLQPQITQQTGHQSIAQDANYFTGIQEGYIAGPSSTRPVLRRIVSEFHVLDSRIRDRPAITCTRKGRILKRRHTSNVATHYK